MPPQGRREGGGEASKGATGAAWHREQRDLNQAYGAHTLFPYLPLMVYKCKGNVEDVYVVISPGYDEN